MSEWLWAVAVAAVVVGVADMWRTGRAVRRAADEFRDYYRRAGEQLDECEEGDEWKHH